MPTITSIDDSPSLTFPMLSDTNYHDWAFNITARLYSKGLLMLVNDKKWCPTASADQEKWVLDQEMVVGLIASTLEPGQCVHIQGVKDDLVKMWEALCHVYMQQQAGTCFNAYDCWGTYAYMYICTKSIQIYFGIFFDFILVLLSFHCSHTILIFSEFFPIFVAVLFISKSLSFQHSTLICFHLGTHIPVHHVESNCIICIVCIHLGTRFPMCQMESKPRAGWLWDHRLGWGICGLRHPLTLFSSVNWPSLRR